MDSDGPDDVPPHEASPAISPVVQSDPQQVMEEELPPEVEREPPILFKEEVNVSSRGTFDALLPPLVASSSNQSFSSYSSDDDDDEDSSSTSSTSSSFTSTSSSSSSYSSETSLFSLLANNYANVGSNPNSSCSSPLNIQEFSQQQEEYQRFKSSNQRHHSFDNDNSRFIKFINQIHRPAFDIPSKPSPGQPPTNDTNDCSIPSNHFEIVPEKDLNKQPNISDIPFKIYNKIRNSDSLENDTTLAPVSNHASLTNSNNDDPIQSNLFLNGSSKKQVSTIYLTFLDDQNIVQQNSKFQNLNGNSSDVNIVNNLDSNNKKHSLYDQKLKIGIPPTQQLNYSNSKQNKILNTSQFLENDPPDLKYSNLNDSNAEKKLETNQTFETNAFLNFSPPYLRKKNVANIAKERPKSLGMSSTYSLGAPAKTNSCDIPQLKASINSPKPKPARVELNRDSQNYRGTEKGAELSVCNPNSYECESKNQTISSCSNTEQKRQSLGSNNEEWHCFNNEMEVPVSRPCFLDLNGDNGKVSNNKRSFQASWHGTKEKTPNLRLHNDICTSDRSNMDSGLKTRSLDNTTPNQKVAMPCSPMNRPLTTVAMELPSPSHKPPISPRMDQRKSGHNNDQSLLENAIPMKPLSNDSSITQTSPVRTSRFLEKIRKRKEMNQENCDVEKEKNTPQHVTLPNNEISDHMPDISNRLSSAKSKFVSNFTIRQSSIPRKSISISPDDSSYHTPTYSPESKDRTLKDKQFSYEFNSSVSSPDYNSFHTPISTTDKKSIDAKCLNCSSDADATYFNFILPKPSCPATSSQNVDDNVDGNRPESESNSKAAKPSDKSTSIDIENCVDSSLSNQHINSFQSHSKSAEVVKKNNANSKSKELKSVKNADCINNIISNDAGCIMSTIVTDNKSVNQTSVKNFDSKTNNADISFSPPFNSAATALEQNDLESDSFSGVSSPSSLTNNGSISTKPAPSSGKNSVVLPDPEIFLSCDLEQVPIIPSNPESVVVENSLKIDQNKDIPSRQPPPYEVAIVNTIADKDSNSFVSSESDMSLCRSLTQSSVDSTMSFGSSYYTLYIVDHNFRPKTPEEASFSPENSPPPEEIVRSSSVSSVSSFRSITPEPGYFEETTKTFRAMRGLSLGSSTDSLLTCFSQPLSVSSTSTLMEDSRNFKSLFGKRISKITCATSSRSEHTSPKITFRCLPARSTSLGSLHSVIRRYPNVTSTFGSISTFGLASGSHSPTPLSLRPERPPSTDSPILFDSPSGSQHSLLLFRPLPRYSARSVSPEPEPAVLCYLGPARPFEPPLVFAGIIQETVADFDGFVNVVADMLSPEEQRHMEELRAYVIEDEGSWALGEDFNMLFARIFHDPSIPDDARRHLLRIMASAALKDDVILMLHQDRKEHTIMNFANKIESLRPDVQEALALFFCNMFEHLSPSEWLLYISEWAEGNQQISNIRITTKVAVNALLHSNPKVQEYGTALMYNLGTKEVKTVVFDDVAPELAMAILQFFGNNPPEEYVWRVITALCRFCYASNEVPTLIKMIGPDPNTYKGMSERIDLVLEEINSKLSKVRAF